MDTLRICTFLLFSPDPEESLLTDPESEQTFDFSLVDSLGKSRDRRLLKDYTIYVTPSVLPPLKEMQRKFDFKNDDLARGYITYYN